MITYASWHATGWSPSDNYWDQAMIADLLDRVPEWVGLNVLVTPGHWRDGVEVNKWVAENGPAIVWVTSDEEGLAPFWEIETQVWKQMPNPHVPFWPDRVLPLGYTPHTRPTLKALGLPLVKNGWVLSAQNTNPRRRAAFTALEMIDPDRVHPTTTFADGDRENYIKELWSVEWAPAPAGNVRADSFRMWEALEAGAVPILDATSPQGDRNIWPDTIGDHPFPVIKDWSTVGDILSQPAPMAVAGVWYLKYKRDLVKTLIDDWAKLTETEYWPEAEHRITTIITASPLPSHPDFDILAETVESVWERLSGEICIAFDGPRDTDDKAVYEEHIRRVAWHANQYWPEVWIHYTGNWRHQAGTIKDVMAEIREGGLLMVEADTPLVGDIPFRQLCEAVYSEEYNAIRFHYDDSIHPDHQYLMKGDMPSKGEPVLRTVQYSQRPHLTTTWFYNRLLDIVPPGARTYVEDCVYGVVANSPWEHFRLGIYAPDGMKRSTHLDGRAGVPKGEFWWS